MRTVRTSMPSSHTNAQIAQPRKKFSALRRNGKGKNIPELAQKFTKSHLSANQYPSDSSILLAKRIESIFCRHGAQSRAVLALALMAIIVELLKIRSSTWSVRFLKLPEQQVLHPRKSSY